MEANEAPRLCHIPQENQGIETLLLDWINTYSEYGIALVAVLAFVEACFGIGLFVSGALLLIVSATLYNNDIAGLELLLPLAFSGALLGDHAGFLIGRHLGPRVHQLSLARKYEAQIRGAESLILRFGGAAIFLGRFVPAIRSLIPAMVGISGFGRLRFSLLDAVACLVWSLALGLILVGIDEVF